MLQDVKALPMVTEEEKNIRFDYWFRDIIAVDLEAGVEMTRSNARRRTGRPSHYSIWTKDVRKVFGLSAFSDAEAIEKANKMFPLKFAKFQASLQEELSHAAL